MNIHDSFYIDGEWRKARSSQTTEVIDPATERPIARIALGNEEDVDRAVTAARNAFPTFSQWSREQRLALLERILVEYRARREELALRVSEEMGAPLGFALEWQVGIGEAHITRMIEVLKHYEFESSRGSTLVVKEPVGVVALITPWNWPLNQITCKVMPALAAGCTMVLKPSEIAPLDALVFAEILDSAGVPAGVFNLVNGTGVEVGEALSRHPEVDMVSFTGSTRAGVAVAKAGADTVKRIHQELGGKSANILLPDLTSEAGLERAVRQGVLSCFSNTGQSCNAPTRMLVPRQHYQEAVGYAVEAAAGVKVGSPKASDTSIGPLISALQFERVQSWIACGIEEGATVAIGGLGKPQGLEQGYYVKPTIFTEVTAGMRIAQEEIFGPVLVMIAYEDVEHAVALANDSPYGLAAYVQSNDLDSARSVARRLRAGTVAINYPAWDSAAPFGGYKRSGNGREYADFGLDEFLEIKGITGYASAQ
ncbi:aldehyde dehydrogenase family protein [Halotalea alkalilenta]|uniref:aldehyde dehydrogenase family protein n=1 Tax=Halotalea alkalilenta TaxID=376489 RepID=UPI0004875E11|nr:aldehyde dehydrogenase family protein [Halotalea alkalilenta]